MINVKSMFSGVKVNQVRNILTPYWKSLLVISLVLVGLTLFLGAEYGLANLIIGDQYFLGIGILITISILFITIAYPFWGYAIWFFLTMYLNLFNKVLPAMFSFDLIMLSLLVVVLTFRALFKREARIKFSIEEVFLILYFIYGYIIRREFDASHAVHELTYLVPSPIFFYFIAKNIITKKKHIYWLMLIIIATGFGWALMGIYEQITQKMWMSSIIGEDVRLYAGIRSVGPAGNYYLYGNMLILTILLCLHILGWMQKFYSRILTLIACSVTLIGLYFGYSRAPYIAFFFSMIITAFLAKYTKRIFTTSIVILFFTTLILIPHILSNNVLMDRFTSQIGPRLATNVTSRNMFKANYLFGVGTGNYRKSVPDYVQRGHTVYTNKVSGIKNDYSHAHSEYYLKLCELGIVGFVLYFGMYFLFFHRFAKTRNKLSKNDVVGHDLACLACAFMVGVHFTMITDQMEPFVYAIIFTVFAMVKKAEFFSINKSTIEST